MLSIDPLMLYLGDLVTWVLKALNCSEYRYLSSLAIFLFEKDGIPHFSSVEPYRRDRAPVYGPVLVMGIPNYLQGMNNYGQYYLHKNPYGSLRARCELYMFIQCAAYREKKKSNTRMMNW